MATDTRLYWIWMQEAVGRGNPLGKKLLETFGGPEAVYNADRAALMAAGVKRKADLKALCDKSLRRARAVLSYTLDCRDWILTPADSRIIRNSSGRSMRRLWCCTAAGNRRGCRMFRR